MNNLSFQQILNNLLPSADTLIYDIFIYPIFFISVIVVFMQSDKQLLPTLLMAATVLLTLLSKLSLTAGQPFRRAEIAMLFINLGIFILPALVAPMTKAKKSRGPAIIVAVLAFVYTFLFWVINQRG